MNRIRYAVAGNGWRAMFFVRAALNLPELFEITGVLCRTKEKAEAFEREHGVKAFWTLDAMLETKPDFVVSCQTKAVMPGMTMELLRRGVPVLSETPLATLRIGEIAESIGFPAGVLNILAGPSGEVAKTLNESEIPRMISLIGSYETGLKLLSQSQTSLKKYSLDEWMDE